MGRPALTEKDLPIGSRNGRWVTTSAPWIDPDGGGPSKGRSYVDVRCDCGTVSAIQATRMLNGNTSSQSCGCLVSEGNVTRSGPSHGSWKGNSGVIAQKIEWLYREKSNPCTDCGQRFPAKMMQFDHVPGRGEKRFQLSVTDVMRKRSLDELRAERNKCDLVCPNCHWLRTLGRSTPDDLEGVTTLEKLRLRSRKSKQDPSVIYPEPPTEDE